MTHPSRVSPMRRVLVYLAMTMLLGLAGPTHAAWPPDPTVNVPLCTTAFSSQVTAAVPDGAGGAIVAWFEDRFGDFDVFARRVRGDGTPLWGDNGIKLANPAAQTLQVLPKAVSDGAGGAIVVWIDGRSGANQLFMQRVDSTGTLLWGTAGLVVANASTAQVIEFSVASDGAGGAVVAWSTFLSGISSDIYAQRVNASGLMQWSTGGRLVCGDVSDQFSPVVARNGAGSFVVAWEDQRAGFRSEVFGQLYNAAGTAQWTPNGLKLVGSAENALHPMLVPSGASDMLLFWEADSLGLGDVRGQRLNALGAPQWSASGPRMFQPGVSGLLAAVTDGLGGAFVVSNTFDVNSGTQPLLVQRVRDDASLRFTIDGVRASSIASNQTQLVAAADNANGLLLAWADDQRGLLPNQDVFAQRMTSLGALLWSGSGVPVCRAASSPSGIAIVHDGAGGAVIGWSDTRNSPSPDVYVQGVDAAGVLGVGVDVPPAATPAATALARPAPNPVPNGSTTIRYTLARAEHVQLRVVDATGRIVTVLEEGERGPGLHEVTWDSRSRGDRLPPGLYLVQLVTPTRSEIRRLVLL